MTHLLPTTRPSTVTMFNEQVARAHLPRWGAASAIQVFRCTRKVLDLLFRETVRSVPNRLLRLDVVEIGHMLRVGHADFPARTLDKE